LAAIVLGVSPITVSWPIALTEVVVLTLGLVAMLAANAALLRPVFEPLERLARRMGDVDLLRPGQRFAVAARGEIRALVEAFNQMLERLEGERRESGRRAVAAQEAERKRVASELHDEVGQAMTAVLLVLARLQDAVVPERRQELVDAQEAIRGSLEEVRRIAQELRPELLEHLGLVSALTALARTFSARTGIEVQCRFAAELPELDREVELAVYRIVQESLTNVARHAGATRARLSMRPRPGGVVVCVVDDGRGTRGGLREGGGVRGMRERAMAAGGELAIAVAQAGGVEVRVDVPAVGAGDG
jgi:two-component system, NarL family, sensor histidine kinase UhpB